jgi:Flp pilus assembly protein TadB
MAPDGRSLTKLIVAAARGSAQERWPAAEIGLVRGDDRSERTPISEVPITRSGRGAFVALVLVAILIALISGSVPVAVAVLAVGGLGSRFDLVARARAAERV